MNFSDLKKEYRFLLDVANLDPPQSPQACQIQLDVLEILKTRVLREPEFVVNLLREWRKEIKEKGG
jgi:hypothetical protein